MFVLRRRITCAYLLFILASCIIGAGTNGTPTAGTALTPVSLGGLQKRLLPSSSEERHGSALDFGKEPARLDRETLLPIHDMTSSIPVVFPEAVEAEVDVAEISALASYCVYDGSFNSSDCVKLYDRFEVMPVLVPITAYFSMPVAEKSTLTVAALVLSERASEETLGRPQRVFVAFSGTQNVRQDVVADFTYTSFKHTRLRAKNAATSRIASHRGFTVRKEEIYPAVRRLLKTIPAEQLLRREVIFTGHSMGSAIAVLTAMDVYTDFGFDELGGMMNERNQVKVFTLGSIPALKKSVYFNLRQENHVRIHCENDRLSRLLKGRYEFTGVAAVVDGAAMRYVTSFIETRRLPNDRLLEIMEKRRKEWSGHRDEGFSALRVWEMKPEHAISSYLLLTPSAFTDLSNGYRDSKPDISKAVVNAEKTIAARLAGMPICREARPFISSHFSRHLFASPQTPPCLQCSLSSGEKRMTCVINDGKSSLEILEYAIGEREEWRSSEWTSCFGPLSHEVPGVTLNVGKPGDLPADKTYKVPFNIVVDSEIHRKLARVDPDLFGRLFTTRNSVVPNVCKTLMRAVKQASPQFAEEGKQMWSLESQRHLRREAVWAFPHLLDPGQNALVLGSSIDEAVLEDIVDKQAVKAKLCLATGRFIDCTQMRNAPWCPQVCIENNSVFQIGELASSASSLRQMCSFVSACEDTPIKAQGKQMYLTLGPGKVVLDTAITSDGPAQVAAFSRRATKKIATKRFVQGAEYFIGLIQEAGREVATAK